MSEEITLDTIEKIVADFTDRAQEEFDLRMSAWGHDHETNPSRLVVGVLLARQLTLAREVARNPMAWNHHIAPILMRAMADVFISAAWILEDPQERAKKFVEYGLGQEKLQVEHRKADLKERGEYEDFKERIESAEAWITSQRHIFVLDVELGSWSGMSTRKMAEECGCLDFYNYVYRDFSGCGHSMWHHVGKFNLRQCDNPLHGYHGIPVAPELSPDPHYLYLAGKYLQKTFARFDEKTGITIEVDSALKVLADAFNEIGRNAI